MPRRPSSPSGCQPLRQHQLGIEETVELEARLPGIRHHKNPILHHRISIGHPLPSNLQPLNSGIEPGEGAIKEEEQSQKVAAVGAGTARDEGSGDLLHFRLQCRAAPLGGRHWHIFPTASHATAAASSPQSIEATAVDALSGRRRHHLELTVNAPNISSPLPTTASCIPAHSQPPSAIAPLPQAPAPVSRRSSFLRRGFGNAPGSSYLQSPFRTRGGSERSTGLASWRPSASRLWNPTNSTPRTFAAPATASRRERRPSTPPPPSVPLVAHPAPGARDPIEPIATSSLNRPLLTISEPRPSISNRASLQIGRSAGSEQRISLPPSVRCSYDEKRVCSPPPTEGGASYTPPGLEISNAQQFRRLGAADRAPYSEFSAGLSLEQPGKRSDKGKGKETMTPQENAGDGRGGFSQDLERGAGPEILNNRHSTASGLSGIGSAISSSDSSIMGDPDQPPDAGEEWGPQHPCYPHLNPHVPVDSPEYANTRIIRIRRDWLLEGDLAPTFSNLYPEILDPAGVTETEFRRVIDKLNGELVPGFSPYNWRNILDGMLGLATGWVWDDLGFTAIKTRLRNLEKWIDDWNANMAKAYGSEEGAIPPKIVSLKQTGYLTLDIQIPDPEIATAPPSTPDASGANLAVETLPDPTA